MKKKYVLALLLAVTATTSMPAQVFAANFTPTSEVSTESEIQSKNTAEFNYQGDNFTAHCRVDSDGCIIMNGVSHMVGTNNYTFVFPGKITHKGKEYQVKDVMGMNQYFWETAKNVIFEEGITSIVLYPNLLQLDELTLPSSLQSIIGGMTMGEKLPNGDPCIYLKGRVNKVNIPENSRFAYSHKYNCIYDKEITTINPDKPTVDKSSLNEAIKAAEKEMVLSDKYTAESISSLNAIVEQAKALLNAEDATQNVIDEMVTKVNQAVKDLVKKPEIPLTPLEPSTPVEKPEKPEIPLTPLEPSTPVEKPEKPDVEVSDKSELEDVIEKAEKEASFTKKYTKDSIANLNAIVKDAKVLLDKSNVTQEEIDAMVAKVNTAMKELVLVKPDPKPDDNKKPVVNDKKPADKTTAPKTGDPASAGMLATLLAGSGATIAAALKKRK